MLDKQGYIYAHALTHTHTYMHAIFIAFPRQRLPTRLSVTLHVHCYTETGYKTRDEPATCRADKNTWPY
jgi:hypothetical protein